MNHAQFDAIDKSVLECLRIKGELNEATKVRSSALFPLIALAITEKSKEGCVTQDHIVEYVNKKVGDWYRGARMQKRLKRGRHTHDGAIAFTVSTTAVTEALKWAVICEVVQTEIIAEDGGLMGICCYFLKQEK